MPSSDRIRTARTRSALGSALILFSLAGCGANSGAVGPTANVTTPGTAAATAATTPPKTPAVKLGMNDDRMSHSPVEPIVLTKQTEPSPFRFTDILKGSGVDFVHFSGMTRDKHFPSANGSGVAMIDYDNDGKLDLYFATATLLPLGTAEKGPNRLYKNLGDGKFQDVTEKAGVGFRGFCHGLVVGDVDNDGDQDLFLCNYGPNVLYLNNGDGTFKDVSQAAGIARPGWSSSGAFLDYDNDGDLDLYVANYGDWTMADAEMYCGDPQKGVRLYCTPRSVRTTKHFFYRNNGDGTFTDVLDQVILDPTSGAPKPRSDGHGFGVVTADMNNDGKIDIYVANDMNPNFLFFNKGNGTFDDVTEYNGAAYDEKGAAQSGMGVDAEDIDGDGLPELFVTNFANEYNTLYMNLGGQFSDNTPLYGLAADTTPFVGWGTALVDLDNDGWPDNFVTNGHVDNNRKELGEPVEYEEPPLLFANKGEGSTRRFRLATLDAGEYFETTHVGRGAAFGDLDNDGDTDIVVSHKDGAPAILRNDCKAPGHWLRFDLQGTKSNRDGVGAKIEVVAGDRTIHRQRKGGVSMLSAQDPRVLFGLGKAEEAAKVTVRWPSGAVSTLEHVKADQAVKVVEPADGGAK